MGLFLLIRGEAFWKSWQERSRILTRSGIPTELVDRQGLQKAEPRMNTRGLMGAAYSLEGMLNPLKFTQAYARAARRLGAEIRGIRRWSVWKCRTIGSRGQDGERGVLCG